MPCHAIDLAAKARERPPAESAQNPGVHPFRTRLPRSELTLHDGAGLRETPQRIHDGRFCQTEAPRGIARDERPVRARIAPQQRHERVRVIARQERGGQPERKVDSERVAVASRVLSGDEPPLAGDTNVQHAALGHERRDPVMDRLGLRAARRDLLGREVPETKEHLVHAVGMTSGALANEVLQRKLEIGHRVLVEELAELHLTEERAQLRRVDGKSLRAQLGERRVALVHEVRDVVEEKRRGERRRGARVHRYDTKLA